MKRMTKKEREFIDREKIDIQDAIDIAKEQIELYGVGSCGTLGSYYWDLIAVLQHLKVSEAKGDHNAYLHFGKKLQGMLIDM